MRSPGLFRLAAIVLAIVAWLAVLLQLWLSVRLGIRNGGSWMRGVVMYLGYFTVITNIFVALVASAGVLSKDLSRPRRLYRPRVVGCATTAIVLVAIVYHVLLRELWAPTGAQRLADHLLHYVVPGLALLHWLVYPLSGRVGVAAPAVWCVYPAIYLAYALGRGELIGTYPYPFIDAATLGYGAVIRSVAGLMGAFVLIGYLMLGFARTVASRVGRSDAREAMNVSVARCADATIAEPSSSPR